MNATWIVKLVIWLCTECCIGFIITQNNSVPCLYLFTMKRSHQIELEYFFKIKETTQKWSDAVTSLWNWRLENCSTNFFPDIWVSLWINISWNWAIWSCIFTCSLVHLRTYVWNIIFYEHVFLRALCVRILSDSFSYFFFIGV